MRRKCRYYVSGYFCSGVRTQQLGVSLIELMVGILIGILVVMAALLNFDSTIQSSVVVRDASRLEQQANFVMDAIGLQIKQAGAINVTSSFPGSAQASKVEFENFAALNGSDWGNRKIIVTGGDGAGNNPDTLTVTYSEPSNGNGGINQNCSGSNAVPFPRAATGSGTAPAVATPQVVSTITVNSGNLTCGIEGVAGSEQVLANNVVDFQVRYLINNGTSVATRTATEMAGNWAGIDGIEVCLHLRGERERAAPTAEVAPAFVDCAGQVIQADGRLHRVVRNVFRLRNSASL